MATKIKIGHASISENNSVNGTAGDSTGKEVHINENFDITSLDPNVLLRPKTKALADASVDACISGCNNNNIGYSQSGRNTLYNLAKANGYKLKDVGLCNTDCSAFMAVCAIAGGSKLSYGSNAPTTSNMRTRFKQSGDYDVLTDSKHLTMTDYLKAGDILVCEGSHTVMVLENGSSIDDDSDSESGSTGVTPITDIRIKHINVIIEDIESDGATASIRISERKSGVADKALSDSKISKYSWSYKLEVLGKSESKNNQINLTSSKKDLVLSGLTASITYALQVAATNKKSGNIEFCSQKILFTTLPNKQEVNNNKQEFTSKTSKSIDRVYVKTGEEFKPVIIYK